MSGATIGGVVGAAIGFYFGGPAGAQWGWMIGSAIGGYVDPEVIEGPKLRDARTQTSRDGVAIPWGWGTWPTAGNIIWQQPGPPTEHEHEDDGKGSGTVQKTYTYTRSYAIGICEGPITGLLQIKRNGKLVYDARTDDALMAEYMNAGLDIEGAFQRARMRRSENVKFLLKVRIYKGDETQDPDPTIESYEGAGNVPSYRGLAYIVVEDDDVTELQGGIPQYEFVVRTCGTETEHEGENSWVLAFAMSEGSYTIEGSTNGLDWSDPSFMPDPAWVPTGDVFFATHGATTLMVAGTVAAGDHGVFSRDRGQTWTDCDNLAVIASGGDCCYSGGYWHVVGGGPMQRAPDATRLEFEEVATAPTAKSCVAIGTSKVIAFDEAGTGLLYRTVDAAAAEWEALPNLPATFSPPSGSAMAYGGSLGLVCMESGAFGGGGNSDFRAHIFASFDQGQTWEEYDSPFADEIDPPTAARMRIRYADELGLWFVSFFNKIACGPSLSTLSGVHTFDENVLNIAADRTKVMVTGNNGMLEYTTGGLVWTALTTGVPTTNILAAVPLAADPSNIPIPDSPGSYIEPDGTVINGDYYTIDECSVALSTIVADLCEREGLTADEYDVSQLTGIMVPGFRIANEGDAISAIAPLMQCYFFDVAEWDGKVRFVLRGGEAVGSINGDDLVERDNGPFERERVQEAELLRRSTVGYIDPAAAFGPTTQKFERRIGTIRARGEASLELPLTLETDTAATIAKRRVLTAWGEPEKGNFSLLTLRHAKYTPTDILNYTDPDGEVSPYRLMQMEDDGGIREIESSLNSAEAYNATATGVAPKPPIITNGALVGPTVLEIMDLPIWRTTDADDIGLYLAVSGVLAGWMGASISVSTDGGTTYTHAADVTVPATIGYTTTGLSAWASAENPEDQSVTVYLPTAPASVDYATLLNYANRAAVQLADGTWEILQYQTVTALGDSLYTLSGLVRGRFNTTPGIVSADATFILLNSAIVFVPIERDMLGESLTVRATSFNTSTDAAVPFTYEFEVGVSQTEWPVHAVEATRDGSDNVSVSCVIRDRLGTETSRYPSVHFAGLRFTYTDGVDSFDYDVTVAASSSYGTHEYTAAMQTADFGSVPGSLTVTIAPLNDITGAGPASAGVTV